jgi:protein-S-isoprenylcysteine O-methyltransferase Ste14
MSRRLFALLRTLIVAPAFVSLWLYFFPRWFGGGPHLFEGPRPVYWIVVVIGAVIGVPCVLSFAWRGLGTPAPFDPPRKLVVTGPYRWVRNPMYVGMGIVMLGEALVYPSLTRVMLVELGVALVLVSIFVVVFEEPVLRRTFGRDYEEYCRNVRRWIPRLTPWYAPAHLD